MGTQINSTTNRLFDSDSLGVTNFKLYPGTSRDLTAEDIAMQISKSLSRLQDGQGEVVNID